MALPPIPNWKRTKESQEAYKPFSQFHCYTTWNYNVISSPLWVPTEFLPFYKGELMKTLNIFYLVIYWTQKVHNNFIFLCSLQCVPYKCSSASEVHGYL